MADLSNFALDITFFCFVGQKIRASSKAGPTQSHVYKLRIIKRLHQLVLRESL